MSSQSYEFALQQTKPPLTKEQLVISRAKTKSIGGIAATAESSSTSQTSFLAMMPQQTKLDEKVGGVPRELTRRVINCSILTTMADDFQSANHTAVSQTKSSNTTKRVHYRAPQTQNLFQGDHQDGAEDFSCESSMMESSVEQRRHRQIRLVSGHSSQVAAGYGLGQAGNRVARHVPLHTEDQCSSYLTTSVPADGAYSKGKTRQVSQPSMLSFYQKGIDTGTEQDEDTYGHEEGQPASSNSARISLLMRNFDEIMEEEQGRPQRRNLPLFSGASPRKQRERHNQHINIEESTSQASSSAISDIDELHLRHQPNSCMPDGETDNERRREDLVPATSAKKSLNLTGKVSRKLPEQQQEEHTEGMPAECAHFQTLPVQIVEPVPLIQPNDMLSLAQYQHDVRSYRGRQGTYLSHGNPYEQMQNDCQSECPHPLVSTCSGKQRWPFAGARNDDCDASHVRQLQHANRRQIFSSVGELQNCVFGDNVQIAAKRHQTSFEEWQRKLESKVVHRHSSKLFSDATQYSAKKRLLAQTTQQEKNYFN